jgi:hypothetical protein
MHRLQRPKWSLRDTDIQIHMSREASSAETDVGSGVPVTVALTFGMGGWHSGELTRWRLLFWYLTNLHEHYLSARSGTFDTL